jgi:hypothetical protein
MDALSLIAGALGFTPDDLQANRAGRVSETQRERLAKTRRRARGATAFMGVLALAFVVVIAIVFIPKISRQDSGSDSLPVVPIIVGVLVLMLLIMGASILRTRRSLDALASGSVLQVSGPAKTKVRRMHGNVGDLQAGTSGTAGGVRFELTIGDVRFFVPSRAVLDAFVDGAPYRGYYVGKRIMATLLSAEPG